MLLYRKHINWIALVLLASSCCALELGNLSIETHLDRLKTNANIAVSFDASGEAQDVEVSISGNGAGDTKTVSASGAVRCYLRLKDPACWSAEKPVLYDFKITDSSGAELAAMKLGIRETELSSDEILINSAPAQLKMPVSAVKATFPYGENTAKMLKGCNANAIILDFGDGSGKLLDLCDELGIYVLARCEEGSFEKMVAECRNHCSVVGWVVPVSTSRDASFRAKARKLDTTRQLFTLDLPRALTADFKLYDKYLYETYAVKGYAPMAETGYEAKKLFEPLYFTIASGDAKETLINISNRTAFTNLSEMQIYWKLLKDGRPVQGALLEANAAPGASIKAAVPAGTALPADAEYVLELLAIDPSGKYELAFRQFTLRSLASTNLPQGKGTLVCSDLDRNVSITGEGFEVQFDISDGLMTSLSYEGRSVLNRGPLCDFTRAPTPYDKAAGIDALALSGLERTVMDVNYIKGRDKAIVRVKAMYAKDLSKPEAPGFNVEEVYSVRPGGVITVEADIEPFGAVPPEPGRIGMQMLLPAGSGLLSYYGRGPAQSYPDCISGSRFGFFSFRLDDMFTARQGTGEYGNRSDVREFSVYNASGAGLTIRGIGFNATASHYPAEHLAAAADPLNPVKAEQTLLNIDYAVSPLERAVSGAKASVPAKFSFTITPYSAE